MTISNVDYMKTYFQVPTLIVIYEKPTYEGLQDLNKELTSNAVTVTSNLGGGAHGHLGLIFTLAQYNNITPEMLYILLIFQASWKYWKEQCDMNQIA